MKGWVGLVGCPIDSLHKWSPVKHRRGKVCQSKTTALHAAVHVWGNRQTKRQTEGHRHCINPPLDVSVNCICFSCSEHWPSCVDWMDPRACCYSPLKHERWRGVQCGPRIPANIRAVSQGPLPGDGRDGRAAWWWSWACWTCPHTCLRNAWRSAHPGYLFVNSLNYLNKFKF